MKRVLFPVVALAAAGLVLVSVPALAEDNHWHHWTKPGLTPDELKRDIGYCGMIASFNNDASNIIWTQRLCMQSKGYSWSRERVF